MKAFVNNDYNANFLKNQDFEKSRAQTSLRENTITLFELMSKQRKPVDPHVLIYAIKSLGLKIFPVSFKFNEQSRKVDVIPGCPWKKAYNSDKAVEVIARLKYLRFPIKGMGFGMVMENNCTVLKVKDEQKFSASVGISLNAFLNEIKKSSFAVVKCIDEYHVYLPYFFPHENESPSLNSFLLSLHGFELMTNRSYVLLPIVTQDLSGRECDLVHFSRDQVLSPALEKVYELIERSILQLGKRNTKEVLHYLEVLKEKVNLTDLVKEKARVVLNLEDATIYECPFHGEIPGPGGIVPKGVNLFLDYHTMEVFDQVTFHQRLNSLTFRKAVKDAFLKHVDSNDDQKVTSFQEVKDRFEEKSLISEKDESVKGKILKEENDFNYYVQVREGRGYVVTTTDGRFGVYSYATRKPLPGVLIEEVKNQVLTCAIKRRAVVAVDPFTGEKTYKITYLYREAGSVVEEDFFFSQPEKFYSKMKSRFLIRTREGSEALVVLLDYLISNAVKVTDSPRMGFYLDQNEGVLKTINVKKRPITEKELKLALQVLRTYVEKFCSVYPRKAVSVLKWFLCAPFSYAVRSAKKRFPFLCLNGATGTGKSTMALTFSHMFASYAIPEEVSGSSADTPARFITHLEKSTFPVVISETYNLFQKPEVADLIKTSTDVISPRGSFSPENLSTFVKYYALSSVCFTLNDFKVNDLSLLQRIMSYKFYVSESHVFSNPSRRREFLNFYPEVVNLKFIFDYVVANFDKFGKIYLKLVKEKKPVEQLIFEVGTEVLVELFKACGESVPKWVSWSEQTINSYSNEVLTSTREEVIYVLKEEISRRADVWNVESVIECLKKKPPFFLEFSVRARKVYVTSVFVKILHENKVRVQDVKHLSEILGGRLTRMWHNSTSSFSKKLGKSTYRTAVEVSLAEFLRLIFPEEVESAVREFETVVQVKEVHEEKYGGAFVKVDPVEEDVEVLSRLLIASDRLVKQKIERHVNEKCRVVVKDYLFVEDVVSP